MTLARIPSVAPLVLALPMAAGAGGGTLAAGLNPATAALAYTLAGIGAFLLAAFVGASRAERRPASAGSGDHG